MKEEDIIKDILEKYPEEKVLAFCADNIIRQFQGSIKALKGGTPEIAAGSLGESIFALNLLKALSDKKNNSDKDTVVVA